MIFSASPKTRFSPRRTSFREALSGTAKSPARGELGSLAIAASWLARADGELFRISTVLLFFRLSAASRALITLRAFWIAVALPMRRTLAPLAMGAIPTSPLMAALSPSATNWAETKSSGTIWVTKLSPKPGPTRPLRTAYSVLCPLEEGTTLL
jgi:hypothetical protein